MALPERRRPRLLISGDHGDFDLDAPALLGIFSADDDCPVDTEKQLGRSHELNLQGSERWGRATSKAVHRVAFRGPVRCGMHGRHLSER